MCGMAGGMVGRDRELAQVLGYLAAPDVRVTLLVGDAGIGKSRPVAETIASATVCKVGNDESGVAVVARVCG
jgi:ATP-dependent Clp protease ATP-binding subunit ClpA